MTRHVGGSLLPSNNPRILAPVETPFGTLQVRVVAELDTHGLFYKHADSESLLAMHPNGHSCRALLENIVQGDVEATRRQALYILNCGGQTARVEYIANLASAP